MIFVLDILGLLIVMGWLKIVINVDVSGSKSYFAGEHYLRSNFSFEGTLTFH